MRNIKKTIKVREVECVVYDRNTKKETTTTYTIPETDKLPTMPEGCILCEHKTVSEKEVIYSMSPQMFVEHATIVEK